MTGQEKGYLLIQVTS